MGVPATTPLGTPTSRPLKDGYRIRIAFAANPNIRLWVKTTKPPGMDAGESIPQTTQHNVRWRTFAPRSLITLTEMTFKSAYQPGVYDQLLAILGVEGAITVHFSDDSTLDMFGFLQKAIPADTEEGKQPEMDITIAPTNVDPTDGSEAGPNYKTGAGTDTTVS